MRYKFYNVTTSEEFWRKYIRMHCPPEMIDRIEIPADYTNLTKEVLAVEADDGDPDKRVEMYRQEILFDLNLSSQDLAIEPAPYPQHLPLDWKPEITVPRFPGVYKAFEGQLPNQQPGS